MGAEQPIRWADAAASTLEWWHDAGVDMLIDDDARDWRKPPVAAAGAIESVPSGSVPAPSESALPDTIEAFLDWRAGDAVPEAGWGGIRIAPSGPIDAKWLVMLDMPEEEDRTVLLEGGPAALLFDRILAAAGLTRAEIRLTSLCTSRPATGQLPPADADALGRIARHHLSLSGASRFILMGSAAGRAVIGADARRAENRLHTLNHETSELLAIATYSPRFLLDRPAAKAELWRDLQLLIRGPR